MSLTHRTLGGICLVVFSMLATPTMAQETAPGTQTKEQSIGYFLGVSIGQQMASQGFKAGDFDLQSLAKGVGEALAGTEPDLSDEQLAEVSGLIEQLLRARQEEAMAEARKAGVANKEKSDLYMQQNAKKEGVKTIEGGVQYSVVESGDGASPSAADTVKVHYTGRLTSGKVFDSSVERGEPATFRVGQVIKGWQDALQKMKVGDKWVLYIPPDLAYGERGVPGPPGSEPTIGPNEVLVFEVELLEIL